MTSKAFDIVVYGATGYTGQLIIEYLNQQYGNGNDVTWAIAGRNKGKLEAVRDSSGLAADTPLVVADFTDEASMQAMMDSAKTIISTVGPYQLYGELLISLCAATGTDYVDLCGEPTWMRQMIDRYNAKAQASGARIVFSCGIDSIPSDMGIYRLQKLAEEKTGHTCKHVECRVRSMVGGFSGGTAATLKASIGAAQADADVMALAMNHYALVPGFTGVEQPAGDQIVYSEELHSWVTPFIMAPINTRNIHRSNALLGHYYGEDFTYDEMMLTGDGEQGEALAQQIASDTSLLGPDAPKPGEGPNEEELAAGSYDFMYIGRTVDGGKMVVSVKADADPCYGSTSRMISEAAMCLLKDATDTAGGIWTSAPAMGDHLIERLEKNAGLVFTLEEE
jgi:short subunit dehydrogenase-like uncharacterized protein